MRQTRMKKTTIFIKKGKYIKLEKLESTESLFWKFTAQLNNQRSIE